MPDDYQSLLGDLGVQLDSNGQQLNSENPSNQNANSDTSTFPESESNTNATVEPNGQNPGADNATDPEPEDSDAKRRNDAFAAMRSENSKYKKFLQQIMKGAGYDGDESSFMDKLTEASYARQAKLQGNQVSPELLKRMDTLENQNKSLLDAQNRQAFAANLKTMQDTLHLEDKDLKEFIQLAVDEQIDLTIPGTNFITLYQGLFFDKLKDRMIEEERQKWIAQNNKANNAATPDGKSGKKDPAPTNVNTMAEFDSLLQQSFPNNK